MAVDVFKNRIRRLVFSRIIWVVIFSGLFSIALYGTFLYFIDLVTSGDNDEEIQFMTAMLVVNQTDGSIFDDVHDLKELGLYPSNSTLDYFRAGLFDGTNSTQDRIKEAVNEDNMWHFVDLMLAVTIYEYNEKTGAFASHFLTVTTSNAMKNSISSWLSPDCTLSICHSKTELKPIDQMPMNTMTQRIISNIVVI